MKNTKQGSTLAVVLLATFAIAMIAASVVGLINFQRNMAIRRELQFQANNVAETAMDYAFAYVSNDVKRKSVTKSGFIPQTEGTYEEFSFEETAKAFLTAAIPAPSGYADATSRIEFSELSVRILPAGKTHKFTVKESVSGSRFNDLDGQVVFETTVPVVARVTASMPGSSVKYTAYIQKQMAFDEVPMFQKAINFQGQLHLHRGYPILGGVHTNGNLLINAHTDDKAEYKGLVTCAGRFYRGSSFDGNGKGSDPYGYCPEDANSELDFSTKYDEDIKLDATNTGSAETGSSGYLRIITTAPSDASIEAKYEQLPTDFDSKMKNWKAEALKKFKGNLMDKSHDVAAMLPPGCKKYRLDDAGTPAVNEFQNGTYVLLHPNITDATHPAYNQDNIYQFARAATLVFRVECLADYKGTGDLSADTTKQSYKWIVKAYKKAELEQDDSKWVPLPMPSGLIGQTKVQTWATAGAQYEIATNVIDTTKVAGANAANPYLEGLFEEFRITQSGEYPINNAVAVGTVASDVKTGDSPISMDPSDLTKPAKDWSQVKATGLGALNKSAVGRVTGFAFPGTKYSIVPSTNNELIKDAAATPEYYYTAQQAPGHGFFNARLGRGVSPITINMSRLKEVLEGTCTDTTGAAKAFQDILFGAGKKKDFNGLIYIEFPTSLKTKGSLPTKRCYKSGTTPYVGDVTAVDSYAFAVGTKDDIEKRHPDRMLDTDDRADRTDNILPIYKNLRGYPGADSKGVVDYSNNEISKPEWAIPALVLVNGKKLPKLGDLTGLSISTNAPLYVIGSYNSDGNFSTGTNILGAKPTDYATNDADEVSAGLFSDTLTILSDTWGKPGSSDKYSKTIVDGDKGIRFQYSFGGTGGYSSAHRKVVDGQVEISACILTGEYPIFEFFINALEYWGDYYSKPGYKISPICIKGAVVGMYHSEIQHMKGAYNRPLADDIQSKYTGHGDCAIPAVRLHEQLTLGIFPPGTPKARDYSQKSFAFLRPASTADAAVLKDAGF